MSKHIKPQNTDWRPLVDLEAVAKFVLYFFCSGLIALAFIAVLSICLAL